MQSKEPRILIRAERAASPVGYDLAIVSTDHSGNSGRLNSYVMKELGYEDSMLPGEKISEGFELVSLQDKVPILFIAVVEKSRAEEDTEKILFNTLFNALESNQDFISGKNIWIPLMGTGTGGLEYIRSLEVILNVLDQAVSNFKSPSKVTISLPDEDISTEIEETFNEKLTSWPSLTIDKSATSGDLKHQLQQLLIKSSAKNFWWINADPKIWKIEDYKAGSTHQYSTHNKKGNKRQVFDNFFNVKPGDLALVYESSPSTCIKAICSIASAATKETSKAAEGRGAISFKILYFIQNQTKWSDLKNVSGFENSRVVKNPQGSLFGLSYDEFVTVVNTTDIGPIEFAPIQDDGEDKIPFHLDQVETTDRLNREPIAKSLARLLNNQIFKKSDNKEKKNKKGHSFMIHLQGAWGDGKSTFLKLLGTNLGTDWVIVDFNAWRHQHIDPPWWIFMDSVYKAVKGSKGHKKGIWWKEQWWRLIKLNSLYWVSFIILFALLLVINILTDFKMLNITGFGPNPKKFTAITSCITIAGSVWILIKSISKSLISASADAAREFKEKTRDSMEELKVHYGEIINYTNDHVAVFIDDLDRCNATFAVELLEGIQTLFKDQSVLYVVAGDRHWLKTCFENYYQSYEDIAREPGQRLGYLFLEKAFQLSLRLPKISGETKKDYWKFILNPQNKEMTHDEDLQRENKKQEVRTEISKDYSKADFSDPRIMKKIIKEHKLNFDEATDIVLEIMDSSSEDVKHLLQNHHPLIDANPRGIKRMANQYTVYRNLLTAEGKMFDRDKLFRWLILQNKYPVYTDWLEEHLIDYKKGVELPEELKILKEDEKWKLLMYDKDNEKGGIMRSKDIALFTDIELHIENNVEDSEGKD